MTAAGIAKTKRRAALLALMLGTISAGVYRLRAKADPGDDAERYFYSDILKPFFVRDERDPAYFRPQRPGSVAELFLAEKPADAYRVFLIGDSIAANYALRGGRTGLQAALAAAFPSKKVELINCGMGGYDTRREALVEREILDYSPDLVILMTSLRTEGKDFGPAPAWRLGAENRLARAAWFESLRGFLSALPGRSKPTPADVDKTLAENLRAMIGSARARGAALLICAPPLNYATPAFYGPDFYSDQAFLAGWIAYLRGDYRSAWSAWAELLPGLASPSPLVFFYMARSAEKMGRTDAARDFYGRALGADVWGANADRLRAMKKAAAEEGAPLADLDQAFRKAAFPKLPGLDMFSDRAHWLGGFDRLVSFEIVRAIGKKSSFRPPWRAPRRKEDDLATLRHALSLLSRAEGPPSIEALLCLEYLVERRAADLSDPEKLARQAETGQGEEINAWGEPALRVSRPQLLRHRGELFLRRRRFRAALSDFSEVLRAAPELRYVYLSQALARALSADAAGAKKALDQARNEGLDAQADALGAALRLGKLD